jgi:hypothetical protein
MWESIMGTQGIETLKQTLRGSLIERNDPMYAEACKLYNGMIDKRPLMIARCSDVADVMATVRFARENRLLLAVRGGGHNGPGLGSCDDGILIDLSPMKGVRVDPETRLVRVGPGCTQGDMDHATHAFGLAVPAGIVSTTGVGGLTLGGGSGYLTRKYGLTVDNLIEADVVLADGSFMTANATQNEDLFGVCAAAEVTSVSLRASCSGHTRSAWSMLVPSSGIRRRPARSCAGIETSCPRRPQNYAPFLGSKPCRPPRPSLAKSGADGFAR